MRILINDFEKKTKRKRGEAHAWQHSSLDIFGSGNPGPCAWAYIFFCAIKGTPLFIKNIR